MSAAPNGIAVTGATGYLGSKFVEALVRQGSQVIGLVRPGSDPGLESKLQGVTSFSSAGSVESLADVFKKARVQSVVHLATLFIAEHAPEQIPGLIQSNIELGTRVAEAAAWAGVRNFLNIGTFWQHYEGKAYSPVSLYAATKQAMEDILRYYSEARGLAVTTLKFAAVYGPGDPRRKIVNILVDALKVDALKADKPGVPTAPVAPIAMSPGEQLMDLVHVDDAVRAVLRGLELLEKSGNPGEYHAYSVTSGKPVTLKRLVGILESASGKKLNIAWGEKPYRSREFFGNWVHEASSPGLPGWRPEIPLEKGLAQLL